MAGTDRKGATNDMSALKQRTWTWQQACFPALVLLGLVDRMHLLLRFGFRYTGSDDSIIWQGATDYARLIFHEPYFYGQDYNPMLEGLLGAPFIALGFAHGYVLPVVTCLLSMAPYWAFGLLHQRQGRHLVAAAFAAMPLLLPVEFAMSTMITRGFVTGLAVLAFWPSVLGMSDQRRRNPAAGLVLSGALFMNPNAAPLVAALGLSFLLDQRDKARSALGILLGTLPFAVASMAARAWYQAHPDRIVHSLYDWRMVFHAEGITEGLGMVGRFFHGLGPWPIPGGAWVLGATAVLLFALLGLRERTTAIGLLAGCAVVLFSWGFAKVHDGESNAFYPTWRMFMALPLLLLWAASAVLAKRPWPKWPLVLLVTWTGVALVERSTHLAGTVQAEVAAAPGQVLEQDLASLRDDAARLQGLCDAYGVDALVCFDRWKSGDAQFPAYLYPILSNRFPATYLPGKDRRHWQRQAVGGGRRVTLLVIGGQPYRWEQARTHANGVITVPDGPWGTAHVIRPVGLTTDSLLAVLFPD
jgi:hypothetical protein